MYDGFLLFLLMVVLSSSHGSLLVHSLRLPVVHGRSDVHIIEVGINIIEPWRIVALSGLVSLLQGDGKIEMFSKGVVRSVIQVICRRPN